MLNTDFSPWPSFTLEEAEAVSRVLLSNRVNYWTGSECKEFEKEFAAWLNCDYAIAVANGTLALEVSLKALGVGIGDHVIVPPRTFLATASAVVAVGATPVFADVDPNTQNISPLSVRQAITKQTKAIICVHLAGRPCDMDELMSIADEFDVYVVEDCAQAHGAKYRGKAVGTIGHLGAWSFCQDKIMSTGGEGGMVSTNTKELWLKVWSYKDHGKSYAEANKASAPPGFRWLHESFGSNYRMTEMQAAIGRIQLRRMPVWRERRAEIALQLGRAFDDISGLRVPAVPEDIVHAYYKFYVFVEPSQLRESWTRDRFIIELNKKGVPCYQGSCSELYLEKAFEPNIRPIESLSVAKSLGEASLMFLVHPTLTSEEVDLTCKVVKEVCTTAFKDVTNK